MEYRRLGNSGLKVSALSLGAWVTYGKQVGEEVAHECMQEAYNHGVNFFDNAEVYAEGKAETVMGNVIKNIGWKRSDLVISTKIFWGGKGPNDRGLSRKHVIEGTKASLERLQLDYVDLLYCHRPDPETPIEETVRAMTHLIDQGLVMYWGTSEWSALQISEACLIADKKDLIRPTMEQPEYNMFKRERVEKEYGPLYKNYGTGTTIWSPLASGMLTGKYSSGIPAGSRFDFKEMEWLRKRMYDSEQGQQRIRIVQNLEPVARDLNCTLAQMAIAWCLKNKDVSSVITGASSHTQVKENMKALEVVPRITDEVMARIDSILGNKPAPEPNARG